MDEYKYDGIINLPHHVSDRHPQLGKDSYAAQFSPFAALTGYDGIIAETARATDERLILDDSEKERIAYILESLLRQPEENRASAVTYFVPDQKKSGGEYVTVRGVIRQYDPLERTIRLTNGKSVPLDEVCNIEAEDFCDAE